MVGWIVCLLAVYFVKELNDIRMKLNQAVLVNETFLVELDPSSSVTASSDTGT